MFFLLKERVVFMAYVNSKSTKEDILNNAFLILADELERANTVFRNQPKFFKKIF